MHTLKRRRRRRKRRRRRMEKRGTHRKIMVLKGFFKRRCGSTKNHHRLKNHSFI